MATISVSVPCTSAVIAVGFHRAKPFFPSSKSYCVHAGLHFVDECQKDRYGFEIPPMKPIDMSSGID